MKQVNEEIRRAETIDKSFYTNQNYFDRAKDEIFAKTWHFINDEQSLNLGPRSFYPFTLLEHFVDEPLLLSCDDHEKVRCLSNVCTHRGFLLADHPTKARRLVCKYHGRSFNSDGTMHSMPEFKDAENFPRPCDHLHELPLKKWRQFLFTSIDPVIEWDSLVHSIERKVGFLPIEQFRSAPQYNMEYHIKANWALYCDNYLEGFHIPFVHETLNGMLDYGQYRTEIYDYCNVQVGIGDEGSPCFKLPDTHEDYGQNITAYYYWVYPNMMLNFYPYGLQINIVRPISVDRCKVSFLFYIYDQKAFDDMDTVNFSAKTEREDEYVVEAVQRGLRSRFYQNGRYSPTQEKGVHHFHRLISQSLNLSS